MTTHQADLRAVTLVAVDTVCNALTELALQDCLAKAAFGDAVYFTDEARPVLPPVRQLPCAVRNLKEHDAWRWYGVPPALRSGTHALVIEWDSWIYLPHKWTPEFLEFDYIGAPWPWHAERSVGNGGFSLRSRALMDYVAARPDEYPMIVHEDNTLSRDYRPRLEAAGFCWAPPELAQRFAFERGPARPSFGFHGLWNWPHVLGIGDLMARLGHLNAYIRAKPEYDQLCATLAFRP